jgi:hypothetical protein
MNARTLRPFLPALRRFGPYLAVELFLPGGTLIALMLWVFQGGARGAFALEYGPAATPPAIEHVVALEAPSVPALAEAYA